MKLLKLSLFTLMIFVVVSCTEKREQSLTVSVDEFFTTLYMPDMGGVTGADGTISILLDDGSSLFLTGDCFLGHVEGGERDSKTKMINNSLIHIDANYKYIASYCQGTQADPKSLCTPLEAATSPVAYWYWPGHGFQYGDKLHLFMTKFYQGGEGQWGFCFDGTDYVIIDMKDYSVLSIEEIYDQTTPIHWGHNVMKDGDYYYVYGTRSGADYQVAEMCVSRAKIDVITGKLGPYEYFDGAGWSANASAAAACGGIDVSVSEQFSVFKHKDKYVLLTQRRAQQAGDIYSLVADAPTGPFRNKKQLYVTTEQDEDKNLFTYNAMAHPQFINEKDELLICYNVNSYNLSDVFTNVAAYRPVFLRVPMKMILE